MALKTRKKNHRFRGSKTHGYGSKKKHRGSGSRGGRGNAGSGKRADTKKPSLWKVYVGGRDPFKKGFNSVMRVDDTTMNVGHLSSIADRLVADKKALVTQGAVVINLNELGITKLLGAGTVKRKLKIVVKIAVPMAKEKIEALGGTIDSEIVDKEAVKSVREARAAEFRKKNYKAPAQQTPAGKAKVEE